MAGSNRPNRVVIFDTTLRDGEQAPGFSMTVDQKVELAKELAALGSDVIEAGFAAASPGDFEAVNRVAKEVKGATICSLARCNKGDIEAAGKALEPAQHKRIHVFIATSPIHREHKLKLSKDAILAQAVDAVKLALTMADEVEFSAEDAIRTERDYLAEVMQAVAQAGASTFNVPDTVGYTTPDEIRDLFGFLSEKQNPERPLILSAHCHNDLGLAVANSLAAIEGGAGQVECTINGIGERAGNAALEEIVMALKTRSERFSAASNINTQHIFSASQKLAHLTGQRVQRNKAIVGQNAFAHEAGIHQHGMLMNRETYEIMKPEDIGVPRSELVLGKHSGKHALAERLTLLGFKLADEEFTKVFADFKALCDRKKEVVDSDLEDLVLGGSLGVDGPWQLYGYQTADGLNGRELPYSAVELEHEDGRRVADAATGSGPVDSTLKALCRATGLDPQLEEFEISALTEGMDAKGQARVRVRVGDYVAEASARHESIITAAALAFVAALNRIERRRQMAANASTELAASA